MSKTKLDGVGRIIVAIAAGLAILVSLYIFFAPLHVQLYPTYAVSRGSEIPAETSIQQSWAQMEGPLGIMVLVIFSGLYSWGYWLARRAVYDWLGVLSVSLLLLSYLSRISIGLLYLPAAVVLLLGTLVVNFSRYRAEAGRETST